MRQRFAYAFAQTEFYRPIVEGRVLTGKEYFGEATLRIAKQPHGMMTTLGLRFDEGEYSLSYAIDFNELTNDMMRLYEGVDVWIADCLTRTPHPTHAHLDAVLSAARDLRVGQVYLTHMCRSAAKRARK